MFLALVAAAAAPAGGDRPAESRSTPAVSVHEDKGEIRRDLQRLRDRVRTTRDDSAKSSQFVNKVQAQLERLSEQFEAVAKSRTEGGGKPARAFADRVRRLQARMDLIDATGKGGRALEFVLKKQFGAAEKLVGELRQTLENPRATLAGDERYEANLAAIFAGLRALNTAAGEAAVQLERVLNTANETIDQMASDEARAASEAR
ncbi:MAG: hypothetical protein RIQ93_1966 [Verrucomicrobiota bacterium]|jgi:peptidoglycan hydrolase CwlO-like protein